MSPTLSVLAALDLAALDLGALDLGALDLGALAHRLLSVTTPEVYRLCGVLCLGLLLLTALAPPGPAESPVGRARRLFAQPWAFALSVLATLSAYRWPIFAREEINPDESVHVTIGIALGRDPLPWRSVDGATAGCLVHYPLTFLNALGFEPNYASARFLGLIMIAAALLLLWRTLRALSEDERVARIAILPGVAVCCFPLYGDYLAYNSEQPLNLIMAGALLLLVQAWRAAPERRWRSLAGLGLCLGAIPITKLQGAPAGVVLALAGYALIWVRVPEQGQRLRLAGLLTACGLLPIALTLAVLASADLVEFFLRSTFVDGATYSQMMTGRSALRRVRDLGSFLFLDSGAKDLGVFNRALIMPALILAGALLVGRIRRSWTHEMRWLVVTSLAFLAATVFGILYPGTRFPHYLLLTVPPLTLCVGLVLIAALRSGRTNLVLALGLGLTLNVIGTGPFTVPLVKPDARFAGPSHLVDVIDPYLRPDDALATWGAGLLYTAQTKRPFHARMPFPFRFIPHVAQRDYWLEGYMRRWEETHPPCLVAASAPAMRLEYVPEVRDYVASHYRLVDAFVDRVYRFPLRIFVSPERLEEILGPGQPVPRLGDPWVPPCARELEEPERLHRTLVDFDAPIPDGRVLQAATDLPWGLTRPEQAQRLVLSLPAGSRQVSCLARTVADDDPSLAAGRPPLTGTLRLRLLQDGRVVASASVSVGPSTHPVELRFEVPAAGDYALELAAELPRAGGIASALLRWR